MAALRRYCIAALVVALLFMNLFVGVVAAEYRTVAKSDTIYIGADGVYDQYENIADPDHNTSYGSLSWSEFLNSSGNESYFGSEPFYSAVYSAPASGDGLTIIEKGAVINATGVLNAFEFYLSDAGFVKLLVFRDNGTQLDFIGESRTVYGFVGNNIYSTDIKVEYGDLYGIALYASNGGMYDEARLCTEGSGSTQYFNSTEVITSNWPKSQLTNQTAKVALRVRVNSTDYNRTNSGRFAGSVIPESPFTFDSNITSGASKLFFGNLVRFDARHVMSGVSEFWVRTPLVVNTDPAGYTVRMKVYRLRSAGFLNVTSVGSSDFSLPDAVGPTLVFDWTYTLYNSSRNDRNLYVSSDNRTFLHAYCPIYPDELYFFGFSVVNFDSDNVTLYYSQCDVGADDIMMSFVTIGDWSQKLSLDMGLSWLFVAGMGKNVRGYRADVRNNDYLMVGFYTYLPSVTDGDYLTFTFPFEVAEGVGLDVRYQLYGVYSNLSFYALVDNLTLDCKKYYMNSTNVSTGGDTFDAFFVRLTFYNPAQYNNRSGVLPTFRFFMYDSNDLWLDEHNVTSKHRFAVGTNGTTIDEYVYFTCYHTFHESNGSWGLYERPTRYIDVYHVKDVSGQYEDPFRLFLESPAGRVFAGLVFGFVWYWGPEIFDWLEKTAQGIYNVLNAAVDLLFGFGDWLYNSVGVYILQAVEWVVDAFIDATVVLIQILLFIIPIAVFVMFVTFWYKILRGFKIWYKRGYTAYALYMETEMIKVFTLIQGSWNLLRMKGKDRRKLVLRQIKKQSRKLTEKERRIYAAQKRELSAKYGLPFRSIPRKAKRMRKVKNPRKVKRVKRYRRVRARRTTKANTPGWRTKDKDEFQPSEESQKDFDDETKGKEEFPGWRVVKG